MKKNIVFVCLALCVIGFPSMAFGSQNNCECLQKYEEILAPVQLIETSLRPLWSYASEFERSCKEKEGTAWKKHAWIWSVVGGSFGVSALVVRSRKLKIILGATGFGLSTISSLCVYGDNLRKKNKSNEFGKKVLENEQNLINLKKICKSISDCQNQGCSF